MNPLILACMAAAVAIIVVVFITRNRRGRDR
jgi:hypothetical protein